jgi:hypothetical protein
MNRIALNAAAWQQGQNDGEAGRRPHPGTLDGLSYMSGYVEGTAQRSGRNPTKEENHER